MTRRLLPIGMALSLLALGACGGPVDDAVDCFDICNDFDACLGDEIDQAECRSACQAEPEEEIESCDVCLDSEGMSCGDCLFECAPLAF